jgi:hypothetical protein
MVEHELTQVVENRKKLAQQLAFVDGKRGYLGRRLDLIQEEMGRIGITGQKRAREEDSDVSTAGGRIPKRMDSGQVVRGGVDTQHVPTPNTA